MLDFLPLPAVIVDLETTGSNAARDRITEVGLVELDADGSGREWSSLVNPGQSIPPHIQWLTGISNDMVAGAPRFECLAAELHRRLDGRLFIAHNARFDLGFLRNEFERCGLRFSARPLDTVRLSRTLYPEQTRHGLEALVARHGLAVRPRHRALGDALAVRDFLLTAAAERGAAAVATAVAGLRRRPSLPPYLEDNLDEIPAVPGVYFFYGEQDSLLYVGKSKNLATRVPAHFAGGDTSPRALRLAQQVRRIDWQEAAGELSALLREARLVKERQPLFNRRLRREGRLCTLRLQPADDGLLRPEVVGGAALAGMPGRMYGLFASPAAAREQLRELAAAHGLCLYATGLERRSARPCPARQLRRCGGHCEGAEDATAHNRRLASALADFALKVWPWPGAVGVVEEGRVGREIQVVDNWCWLGTATSEEAAVALLAARPAPVFDRDTYRLLVSALLGARPPRVISLVAGGNAG